MSNKYESSRSKQKKALIIILVVFILSLTLTIVLSPKEEKTKKPENTVSETISTQNVSDENNTEVTHQEDENNSLISATVTKVIDGKTVEVQTNNETIEVVLIGVDIPDNKQLEAKTYIEDIIKENNQVYLQYDEATTTETGQHLCYVWLTNKVNVQLVSSVKEQMLQAKLIKNKLAVPADEYPNSRYEYAFSSIGE